MANVCSRCGIGAVKYAKSNLKKQVFKADGFRDKVFYVHAEERICIFVQSQRGKAEAAAQAQAARDNVWFRRLARKVRSIMKINSGTVAFIVAFVLMFAVVGISYALAVPYDPGFPCKPC